MTYQLGQIVASYDHRFYTQRGWLPLEQITTSDCLICDRRLNIQSIDIPDLSKDDCWLIGCLMGNSTVSQCRQGFLQFINTDQEIVDQVSRILSVHEMKLVLIKGEKHKYLIQENVTGRICDRTKTYLPSWLRTIIKKHEGTNRSFSSELMMLPNDKIAGLLGGLYDVDGTASSRTREDKTMARITVCYNTSSYRMKNQIIFLLKRLGIQSTVARQTDGNMYCVNVLMSELKLFGDLVDVRLIRK